jgi:hypothetical protein
MNTPIDSILAIIRAFGSNWAVRDHEGPRVGAGRCAYCKGLCQGATSMCELRVRKEAQRVLGR